jgi:hypothetical protein
VFINDAPGGATSGTWVSVGKCVGKGCDAAGRVAIPRGRFAPGDYRLGVNVQFTDGTILYWYQQPLRMVHFEDAPLQSSGADVLPGNRTPPTPGRIAG